ncbi:MAG: NADH-quinone oxidoreductase subunit L [Planctomycetota bacterium]|jgi:NADH-quinone oxidoreductase subunit L
MLDLLWLIPALPFAGFLVLALYGSRLPGTLAAWIGPGAVGLSAAVTFIVGAAFLSNFSQGQEYTQTLWTWVSAGGLDVGFTLYLDALSLVMIFVVTFVGFLIHVYAVGYMEGEEGIPRFFAYMNLFVAAMLMLVLGDSLLLLYLGWEGVGLCSYLLIGFWYRDADNGLAARKAFVVTRIGDTAMAIGLFLLFKELGSINIQEVMSRAQVSWEEGSGLALAAALLLLGGAVGKSAQLPLQTWLPDAMAGPTPVSALIHAATMVTAGVYLIARTHAIFLLAPAAMHVVALIGALTLLISGFSALCQRDIKRVLAYSTISQIGYMFLALGVGAWSAAIFHLMTHAFFKALLFMGAGAIIICLHHEQDIFRMGGLRRKMPVVFWTFLIGAASLVALPLVTAGFYSKDLILWRAWSSEMGSPWLWAAGCAGAFLTALYTFRMVFIVFFGEARGEPHKQPGRSIVVPLIVLSVLSVVGGALETPETLGHVTLFTDLTHRALPAATLALSGHAMELILQCISGGVALVGIILAWFLFLKARDLPEHLFRTAIGATLNRFWLLGWGFDWLYDTLVVRPALWIARVLRRDLFDLLYTLISLIMASLYHLFAETVSGRLRLYAWGIAVGAVAAVAILVFL